MTVRHRERNAKRSRKGRTAPAEQPADDFARIAGHAAVAAVFATAPKRVVRLFFDEHAKPLVGDWCAALATARKPYRMVPAEELTRIAGTPMHGGVVALVEPRPVPPFDARDAAAWAADGKLLLLLDGVGNPQNLGAIARTAAFFGVPRMVLSDNPAQALPSDASARIAEGGLEHIAVYRAQKFARALQQLRRAYRVIGAAAEGGQPLDALRRSDRPPALVLGNEEDGLPAATRKACEVLVTIPGVGALQSLNVASSAAVLIHALSSGRG